jgi:hypothetical protein
MYGGMTGGGIAQNQLWAYDVPTRKWTRKALSSQAPPVYVGSGAAQPALAYDSQRHTVLFHQTSGTGAPSDWEYSPPTDTWQKLGAGTGPATDLYMTYDPVNNALIGFCRNAATGEPDVWYGALSFR